MFNEMELSDTFIYLCEIFEFAYNKYFVTYGEKPSKLIISPHIYNQLQFEYADKEPTDFMGVDIFIDDKMEDHQVFLI